MTPACSISLRGGCPLSGLFLWRLDWRAALAFSLSFASIFSSLVFDFGYAFSVVSGKLTIQIASDMVAQYQVTGFGILTLGNAW